MVGRVSGDVHLGCADLRLRLGDVKRLFVAPAARNCGLGARPMGELERLAQEQSLPVLRMDNRPSACDRRRPPRCACGSADPLEAHHDLCIEAYSWTPKSGPAVVSWSWTCADLEIPAWLSLWWAWAATTWAAPVQRRSRPRVQQPWSMPPSMPGSPCSTRPIVTARLPA